MPSVDTAMYYRDDIPFFAFDNDNKYAASSSSSSPAVSSSSSSSPVIDCTLPWVKDNDLNMKHQNDNDNEDVVHYLEHWNWQVAYFQQHLTNFRLSETPADEEEDDELQDLMSIHHPEKQQRVYTVSYTSDEYRDIRMTYMSFPGSQVFRCLCYPNPTPPTQRRSGCVPILGMGMMKFGNKNNMAVLDYQPLPTTSPAVRTQFETELRRIRNTYPTMTHPMSQNHFEAGEERQYFTDIPLMTKWEDHPEDAQYRTELRQAQQDYVQSHIRLTQQQQQQQQQPLESQQTHPKHAATEEDILQVHADFDTYVSQKEPAGRVLMGALGKELGHALTHRVIFPLSRNVLH